MKRKRFYKGIAASLALCMLIPSLAYAAAGEETEVVTEESAVQTQTDAEVSEVLEIFVQEQADQPEISDQEPADADLSEKPEQEPVDAVLPEIKTEKMPSDEIAEFAELYSERQKEIEKTAVNKAAMNKAAVQKFAEPDNVGSIIPENQWLQTASTRVWYFGDGLFYSLKDNQMDVLGFWIVGATAVQNGDIWTVEGGTKYEYEEYKNTFGKEPPLPEELENLRPEDPNPNPNPGDGDDDKDNPDNPGTGEPDPDDPDNPGTDDPDPDDPDNPGTDDSDPGTDDPDPDEPEPGDSAPKGEWIVGRNKVSCYWVFDGWDDLIYETTIWEGFPDTSYLKPTGYTGYWVTPAWVVWDEDDTSDGLVAGWIVDVGPDFEQGLTYDEVYSVYGKYPPIPDGLEHIYIVQDNPPQGGGDEDTDSDGSNEPTDDSSDLDKGEGVPDNNPGDASGEDSEESGSVDPEQEDADTDSENRQPDGANDAENKKSERDENVEKAVDLLAEKLKEAGIQIAKDQLEKWADHFWEKYPPLNTAKNTLEKINAAYELYKTGKQIAEDWAKVTEAQEKADQAGVRNEEVAPFAKKWTSEIAENVYDLLPTEWTDFFLITNDQTGKILGEKAGNWAAGFVNYVQKPAYQQRDILREFGNENPEMSYN